MIRSPEELSKPIESVSNRKVVILAQVLLSSTVVIHTLLAHGSTSFMKIGSVIFGVGVIILSVFRVFDLANFNKHPRTYLYTYYVLGFFGYVFITDPATPYTAAVFLLLYLSNLYYGKFGVKISIAYFAVVTLCKYAYQSIAYHDNGVGLTFNNRLDIIVAFFVYVATAMFFMTIQTVFDWDRARIRDSIKEAVIEQKRLRALINNMTESVLVLDKEGVIRLYNAAALALFNTNNSLTDKPLDGIILFEDEKGKIITTADLLPKDSKPIVRNDVLLRYSKDDLAALSIISTPIRTTFGQEHDEEGYVMTMRDITREKSLEEERDEFISVISHELRTPVTVSEAGISNAIMQAKKLANNEMILKSLNTAHDQSIFLANMLNDLSTFARAEKGMLEMKLEEFDPRSLIENLMNDYHASVDAKGMRIVTQVDPSTPVIMVSNRLYIREILQNFITNAVKYSDKGTITLMTRAKDKGILYSVADQGIGISTADQKKVFEKFFRTEDYRTRSTNGTGLGLYIVKKLAKILNASFVVQSEVGKGSIFSLYVPDMSSMLAAKNATDAAAAPAHNVTDLATHQPIHATPPANLHSATKLVQSIPAPVATTSSTSQPVVDTTTK